MNSRLRSKVLRSLPGLTGCGACVGLAFSVDHAKMFSRPVTLCQDPIHKHQSVGDKGLLGINSKISMLDGISIHETGKTGKGLFCGSRGIKAGTVLLHVPGEATLTADHVSQEGAYSHVLASLRSAGLDDRGVLALWLLLEATSDTSTNWSGYIRQLPNSFDMAQQHLLFSQERLDGTTLQATVDKMKENIVRQIRVIVRVLSELGISSAILSMPPDALETMWIWAHSIVLTRSGLMKSTDKSTSADWTQQTVGIIPLVDFVNHSDTPNAQVRVNEDGSIDLVSLLDLKPNDEVHISYWGSPSLTSEQSLFSFGFPSSCVRFALPGVTFSQSEMTNRKALQRLVYLDCSQHAADESIYLDEVETAIMYFTIDSMDAASLNQLTQSYLQEGCIGPATREALHKNRTSGELKLIHLLSSWRSQLARNALPKNPYLQAYLQGLLENIDSTLSHLTVSGTSSD